MPGGFLKKRVISPIAEFVSTQSGGALALFAAAAIALLVSNSIYATEFRGIWEWRLPWGTPDGLLQQPLQFWINDGLMTFFFLLAGLEIKRELAIGELSSLKLAAFPVASAIGGMLIPAVIYVSLNPSGAALKGWGVPMATDIAFSLGVLGLLGKRIPLSLKVFLTAFAIADDLGAVIVIALFYSAGVQLLGILGILTCGVALLILNAGGTKVLWPYMAVGALLWYACYRGGVHTTVAAIVTAMFIPIKAKQEERDETAPSVLLEHRLETPVGYWIVPLFGLANAGVPLSGASIVSDPVSLGTVIGLVVGKPLGILSFAWLSVKLRMAKLPEGVGWGLIAGAAILGGIGFTMSLFIAGLAFGGDEHHSAAKIGILAGSLIAALAGGWVLRAATSQKRR